MLESTKILIVEDQNIVAMDLQNCLKTLNYNVSGIAFSGAGAIKKAQETSPDLILMDVTLKGDMDGISAAEEIKKRFNIPIIYLTSYADPATIQRAKETEPFGYIIKPFEEKELNRMIEIALHKHKIEKEIKEKENYLKSALDSLEYGVLNVKKDGTILFVNKYFLNLTEYEGFNFINKKLSELLVLLKVDHDKNINNNLINQDESTYPKEISFVSKSGKAIKVTQKILYNKEEYTDNISGITIIIEPITEDTYSEKNKEIFKSIDFLGKLANKTANDISNLLTGITFNLSLIKKKSSQENIMDNIDEISFYSSKLKKLLETKFSFYEEDNYNPTMESVCNLVNLTLKKLDAEITKGISFEINYTDKDNWVYVNKEQVIESIKNILENAIEASDKKGVIEINTEVITKEKNDFVRLSILDKGEGIKKETTEKVFEPYFSTKSKNGMGLTRSLILIAKNNGYITFQSKVNLGTKFEIYLPVEHKKS